MLLSPEIREMLGWFALGCVISIGIMVLHIIREKLTEKPPIDQ